MFVICNLRWKCTNLANAYIFFPNALFIVQPSLEMLSFQLSPRCYTFISTLQCSTLTVWYANFEMGSVVPNRHYLLNCQLQTDGKHNIEDILSHVNQKNTTVSIQIYRSCWEKVSQKLADTKVSQHTLLPLHHQCDSPKKKYSYNYECRGMQLSTLVVSHFFILLSIHFSFNCNRTYVM